MLSIWIDNKYRQHFLISHNLPTCLFDSNRMLSCEVFESHCSVNESLILHQLLFCLSFLGFDYQISSSLWISLFMALYNTVGSSYQQKIWGWNSGYNKFVWFFSLLGWGTIFEHLNSVFRREKFLIHSVAQENSHTCKSYYERELWNVELTEF